MADLVHRDYRSVASDGVNREAYLIGDTSWVSMRERVGAMPRISTTYLPPNPTFFSLGAEDHWGPWRGEEPLRVLIDAGLFRTGESVEPVSQILRAGTILPESVRVCSVGIQSVAGATPVRVFDLDVGAPLDLSDDLHKPWYRVALLTDEDENLGGACIIHSDELMRDSAWARNRASRVSAIAFHLHRSTSYFDLFVTADRARLRERWSHAEPLGVVAPDEAEAIVQTLMRTLRAFPMCDPLGASISIPFREYANAVGAVMMPTVHLGIRSCLAPHRRLANEGLSDVLEALLARQGDLVRLLRRLRK